MTKEPEGAEYHRSGHLRHHLSRQVNIAAGVAVTIHDAKHGAVNRSFEDLLDSHGAANDLQ